ncbi:MAG TPA: hypothetical protein VHX60_10045 [Acidobacteriaceae bacterium]|jgi:hypothetical protein|nr:hypothetical protein [Acidobacteriaceae bacterium]
MQVAFDFAQARPFSLRLQLMLRKVCATDSDASLGMTLLFSDGGGGVRKAGALRQRIFDNETNEPIDGSR